MALQIQKKFIGNDQVDGEKILLNAGQAIKAKDSSNVEQDLIKLGASDEVLVKGQEVALKAALDQEVIDRAAGDDALDLRLDAAEGTISTHTSQISTLQSDLSLETSNRIAADNDLDFRLDAAEGTISTHTSQISTLQSDLSLETSNRIAADNDLDFRLDAAEGTISTHTSQISTLQSDLSLETSNRIAADNDLDFRLDAAEGTISTHTSQISTLQSDLSLETSNRIAADNDLDFRLDAAEGTISTHTSQISTLQSEMDIVESTLATKADLIGGLVPANQLPSYVDDVLEYANLAAFPATGEEGKIYVAVDTGKVYRWSGTVYIQITSGAVDTVNGQNGVVVLDASDIQMVSEATSIESKLVSLQGEIDAEETARAAADSALQGEIDAEEIARAAADSALQGEIDAEEIARAAADVTLQNNIDTEETARINADNALDARVDDLEAIVWFKESFSMADSQTSVTLTHAPIENSMSAFVDRLAIHEDSDYSISGTAMTFLGDLVAPGQSELGSGDTVYVKYQYSVV